MYIKAEKLSVFYDKKQVLFEVDFQGKQHEIIAIVGPNGCGKTTLLKTLSRLIKADAGSVEFEGQALHKIKSRTLARKMAVLPQVRSTPEDFDVKTLIGYGRFPHGKKYMANEVSNDEIIKWALHKTGMTHHQDKKLNQLSGGERQRAWIAMALAQKTELILLDEPTTFLDVAHQLEILELIKSLNETEGVTIIMVLHDLNQAMAYADTVYVMDKGKIVCKGKAKDVINSEVMQSVFRVDVDFYEDQRRKLPFFMPYAINKKHNCFDKIVLSHKKND